MNQFAKKILENTGHSTVLAFTALLILTAGLAGAQGTFLSDGAVPNSAGGWDLPAQGTCTTDLNQATRPDCLALRLPAANSAACTPLGGSWATSNVCDDLLHTTQVSCEGQPDRKWNAASGVCAIVMFGDDRNDVVCALHNGNWVTTGTCTGVWAMPAASAYNPPLLTGTGPGDQCLRCHNSRTQYNSPRVRDTEDTIYMGHKNMSRKVTVGMPWGGPPFACTGAPAMTNEEDCFNAGGVWDPTIYPGTDTGQDFDWVNGTVDIGPVGSPNPRSLYWIYADWLSAYPRAIYHDVANTATNPDSPKVSYSCARCHTTGFTADTMLQVNKEPHRSFLAEAPAGSNPVTGTPSIVWDGVSDAVDGQVSLAPGAPYNTKMASWDAWGITCSRCHSSMVSGGTGTSSHHSALTSPDAGSGYCTDTRFTAQAPCDVAGAAWLTACSVAGSCSNPTFTTSGSCALGSGTWTAYTAQAACTTAGGTWQVPAVACSIPGVCNDPVMTTALDCTGTVASGPLAGLVREWKATTDVIRCQDAGGTYTGSKTNRGQVITGLCMNCHRQEASGAPIDPVNPSTALKVGPYHSTVTFISHPHSNQFLNSPHGKFTGAFDQVATGKFNYAMTGEYKSHFMADGEAANTGNGCTGCHNVHSSTVAGEKPFAEECTECHNKNLASMIHSGGPGTPLEEMATDPMEACVICHMPAGEHLFRINVDPNYSTKPAAALTATVNANTAPDGNFPNAVWVDLDSACGKCHGGGVAIVETTGSIAAGAKLLTVATGEGANFTAGQRVEIQGAGSLYYDDAGTSKSNDDLESYIVSIAGDVLTLAGNATKTVANAPVAQNPTKNNAAYFTKAQLAVKAAGIHNDKPYATFGYSLTPGNTLELNVDASYSNCSGNLANCDAFVWEWDDATTSTTATPTATHLYATGGAKSVKLTVREYGVSDGSVTKVIKVFAGDAPPVAGGTDCASIVDPNTWSATLVDNSTDTNGVKQVTVKWGDGGAISSAIDNTPPYSLVGTVFTHTYLNPATVTIKQTAYDTIGQANVRTCPAVTLSAFSIDGNVRRLDNSPVANAAVKIKLGAKTVRTVYTNALGNYAVGRLKPGTYNVTVTKTGLTFAQVYNQLVGPSASGLNFQSAQ